MSSEKTSFVEELDENYPGIFGVLAGYLPLDRDSIDEWHRSIIEEAAAEETDDIGQYERSIQELATLIERNGIVRMYVTEMINQVPAKYKTVRTINGLLKALNHIIKHAPKYNPNPKKQNFFPLYTLFLYMMYTRAGGSAFRDEAFNSSLCRILDEWRAYLDSQRSQDVLNMGEFGWLSPSARKYCNLDEFVIPDRSAPHWGFQSFNDFFHRQVRPECRPIAAPDDPDVVVSANDGTVYKLARKIKRSDLFWIKGQPYSLIDMLDNSPFVDKFVGGDVLQTFLAGNDYHRWRAPIAGVVKEARRVPGLTFSQLRSLGFHPNDPSMLPQGYDACVNARGLIFIESDEHPLGMVCVIPVGITEVSSVTIEVEAGQRVKKGDELGYFSYGGSSLCLVFQEGAIDHFTIGPPVSSPDDEWSVPVRVNAQIAVARSSRGGRGNLGDGNGTGREA
jgi:phosphatidylserine decarboxylase